MCNVIIGNCQFSQLLKNENLIIYVKWKTFFISHFHIPWRSLKVNFTKLHKEMSVTKVSLLALSPF